MKNRMVSQMTIAPKRRVGITLMEVLIAVGILAIGLSSVIALLPAGHSMAQRSFVTDQAAIIAANAAADFVTQGYLRPASISAATPPVIFDPLYDPASPGSVPTWPKGNPIQLKTDGALASSASSSYRASQPVSGYLMRGRDDLVYNVPENPNVDVTNRFSGDRVREYQGKFTWAAMLSRTDGAPSPFEPGDDAILSVIVFHQREPGTPRMGVPAALYQAGLMTWGSDLVPGRKDSEVLRTGGAMLLSPQGGGVASIRRIALASIDAAGQRAFLDFEGGDPPGVPPFDAYLLPDAVAVLERDVTIETTSGFVP